jgi:hypothetical protein
MRTPEEREKHAAYMREYNKQPENNAKKRAADASYRNKDIENYRARQRWRNMKPERKAQKRAAHRRRYEAKKEEILAYSKAYYRKNKHKWDERRKGPRVKAYMKAYARPYGLKRRHGITLEQYEAMLLSQNGLCAICGHPPDVGVNKRLHVDHDHATGKIRGLLCMHCNHSIERVEKIPGWAAKTEAYLARPR